MALRSGEVPPAPFAARAALRGAPGGCGGGLCEGPEAGGRRRRRGECECKCEQHRAGGGSGPGRSALGPADPRAGARGPGPGAGSRALSAAWERQLQAGGAQLPGFWIPVG